MAATFRALAACALITVLGTGCVLFPSEPRSGLGLELMGAEVRLVYLSCPGETITEVTLFDGENASGRVIWKVTARGKNPDAIVLGQTPHGWHTDVPLVVPLSRGPLSVELTTTTHDSALSFELKDMAEGEIWSNRGPEGLASFNKSRDCRA